MGRSRSQRGGGEQRNSRILTKRAVYASSEGPGSRQDESGSDLNILGLLKIPKSPREAAPSAVRLLFKVSA